MDTTTAIQTLCGRLLLRVEEAGEILGLKRSKMWALIAQGRIKVVKIDGATRIPASEVSAFVERAKSDAGQAPVA